MSDSTTGPVKGHKIPAPTKSTHQDYHGDTKVNQSTTGLPPTEGALQPGVSNAPIAGLGPHATDNAHNAKVLADVGPAVYVGLGTIDNEPTKVAPPMTSSFPNKGTQDLDATRRRLGGGLTATPHTADTTKPAAPDHPVHNAAEVDKVASANRAAREAQRAAQEKALADAPDAASDSDASLMA